MQARHDLPVSGGHQAFKAMFDESSRPLLVADNEISSLIALLIVVMPANVGKLHTAGHRQLPTEAAMYQ